MRTTRTRPQSSLPLLHRRGVDAGARWRLVRFGVPLLPPGRRHFPSLLSLSLPRSLIPPIIYNALRCCSAHAPARKTRSVCIARKKGRAWRVFAAAAARKLSTGSCFARALNCIPAKRAREGVRERDRETLVRPRRFPWKLGRRSIACARERPADDEAARDTRHFAGRESDKRYLRPLCGGSGRFLRGVR